MGCGASKAVAPAGSAPLPRDAVSANRNDSIRSQTSAKSARLSLSKIAEAARSTELANQTEAGPARHWKKLAASVTTGLYTAWDNIDLPLEGPEEDYFEDFASDQDDYKFFLRDHVDEEGRKVRTDYAEADDVVPWSEAMLKKLKKDKSARGHILRDAKAYGDQFDAVQDRHITVIYNPVGGGGKARRLVGAMVIPVLQLSKLKFRVMPTKHRRHAVEMVKALDINSTDGLIVCGGDGLVHEVVTGYMQHPNHTELESRVPVGICPCGTANAMANALHTHNNTSQISIVGRAALAACKGATKCVDVIKCTQDPLPNSADPSMRGPGPVEIYALSCFGWGMAGAVALKADKLRWIPGQRSMRYDIAGFVSLISDWPVADKATLEYREFGPGEDKAAPWKKVDISLINLIVTNLDRLGRKHPIYPGVSPDDGRLVLSYVDANDKKNTRRHVVKLGLAMKKGKHLGKGKGVVTYSLREFKITPHDFKSPYNVDGDPHDVSPIHVECLPSALRLFYLPEDDGDGVGDDDDDDDVADASDTDSGGSVDATAQGQPTGGAAAAASDDGAAAAAAAVSGGAVNGGGGGGGDGGASSVSAGPDDASPSPALELAGSPTSSVEPVSSAEPPDAP